MESSALEDFVVAADADQLRQVLWNLCLNAFQAMPEGGQLFLSTAAVPAPTAQGAARADRSDEGLSGGEGVGVPWVEVSVRDTGVGIDPEGQEQLFEPFFTTKAKGTGLGLATVHRIVEAHGGVLRVASEPGQGSVFGVSFPQAESMERE
jgi:signal transduction histidine kinase